ncbi:MAG TPA: rhodanese-like domain-containing protein [Nitrososphaeraceae archaeon]|nr:rhodanese-like domain-containing protein [Nitrososphaeraceae archaeon]
MCRLIQKVKVVSKNKKANQRQNNSGKNKHNSNLQSKIEETKLLLKQKGNQKKKTTTSSSTSFTKLPIICDVDTLRTLIRKKAKVRVVDVRRIEDYTKGHIPTAVSLPLAVLLSNDTHEQIIKLLEDLGVSDGMPIVVYDDTFGALAARVAWTFQYVGHENTSLLEMTYTGWKNLGLEIEKRNNKFPKAIHSLKLNQSIYADAQYVESVQNNPDKILVDSRERLNFLTEHIPSAKNIPYTMLGDDNHILRPIDEIKRFIENRGISPDAEIITYCGSVGTLSGLAFYALKLAGIKNVKLYSKSFKDWKSLGKPKIEFKDANYWDLSAE